MYQASDVTLYVPSYNARQTLGRCLEALQKQTVTPQRLLVIDDGSDPPIEPVLSIGGVEVIGHSSNHGLASARNTALTSCETALIASVDADVLAEPTWLEKLLHAMNNSGDGEIAGVGGAMHEMHQTDLPDRWRARHMAQHWGPRPLRNPRFLYGCNTLLSAGALRGAGGYDARLRRTHEDRTICEALYAQGRSLLYEPAAVCQHLRHDGLADVLRQFWQWHQPVGMLRGDFDSLAGLVRRIEAVNFGIFRFRCDMDERDGRRDLLGLDAALPWVFAALDLQYFSAKPCNKTSPPMRLPIQSLAREMVGDAAAAVTATLRRLLPAELAPPETQDDDTSHCDAAYVEEMRRCLRAFHWDAACPALLELADARPGHSISQTQGR